MVWVLSVCVGVVMIEFVSYLLYCQNTDVKELVKKLLKKEQKGDIRTFTPRYAEHPFLAFSLNPDFKNSFGEKIHNKYGFREKGDFSDLEGKRIIYCAGASTTYCNFTDRSEYTWPRKLEAMVNDGEPHEPLRVVNGGCGAWTSYQSLIRFSAWMEMLKPAVVIVYHGKNDFSPFVNGVPADGEMFPDYGNVMRALRLDKGTDIFSRMARWSYAGKILYGRYINARYGNVLWHVYGLKKFTTHDEARRGLARVGQREWTFILSRYKAFAALCRQNNIKILFVTQKVTSEVFTPFMEELNERLRSLEDRSAGVYVYDFVNDLNGETDMFSDHMHFTEHGSEVFARKLKDYITAHIPLPTAEKKGRM